MIEIQRDYQNRKVQIVAINSNDSVGYPEDSFEEMVKRSQGKGFNFPYLHDREQTVAQAYHATHTPHLFVFDSERKLTYTGKIDDNWENSALVQKRYLRDALDDLSAGKPLRLPETHAIGCTIKWKR